MQPEHVDCGHDLEAYQRQEAELAQARADVERLTVEAARREHLLGQVKAGRENWLHRAKDFEEMYHRARAERDRLAEKLRQYEWPGTPTYQQLAESHAALLDQQDEWRREMREMGAEYERLAEKLRQVREAMTEWRAATNDLNVHTLAAEIESMLGDPAAAVDAVRDGQAST